MNFLRGACLLILGLAPLAAQEGLRVEGTVVDEVGAPIAGAEISILVHRHESDLALVERVLSEHPLPQTRSDRDGRYSLVFDTVHLFMTVDRPALGLKIAKEGHQSWVEHLPAPLDNYQGSDAVLPLLTEDDFAEVTVAEPVPGMLLYLRRVGEWPVYAQFGFFPWEKRVLEVPDDGHVRIPLPLLPNPTPNGIRWGRPLRLDFQISLWFPGRSAGPKLLLGGDRVQFGNADAGKLETPEGVRTLCRCEDGELRWFPGLLRARDTLLEPVATSVALPERDQPITLQILDEAREGLGSARVRLFPLTALPPDGDPRHIRFSQHRPPTLSVDRNGKVVLHPPDLAEPGFLLIEARARTAHIERLDRAREEEWQVELKGFSTASLRLRIEDSDGEPIEGAMVILNWRPNPWDKVTEPEALLPHSGKALLSDADGLIEWIDLPVGSVSHRVFTLGHPPTRGSSYADLADGTALEEFIQLKPSREVVVQVQRADGRPVPFAPVQELYFTGGYENWKGSPGQNHWADGRGRIRFYRDENDEVGNFRGAGSRSSENRFFKYKDGRRLVIEVAEQRPVAFRTADPMKLTAWADLSTNSVDTDSLRDWSGPTIAVLFDSVLPRVLIVENEPPIIFDPLAEEGLESRSWPIDFGNDVPTDLTKVEAQILAIDDTVFVKTLEGVLFGPGPEGNLELSTWGDHAYQCLFLHPAYLPVKKFVNVGPVGTPVRVDFEPGVRVQLRYELSVALPEHYWYLRILGAGLPLPSRPGMRPTIRLGTYALEKGVHRLELPFALPRGKNIELGLGADYGIGIGRDYGRPKTLVSAKFSTGDGPDIEVDLGTIEIR